MQAAAVVDQKEFSDYSVTELNKNKAKYCKRCVYRGGLHGDRSNIGDIICRYITIKKVSRGCSPIECKKFTPGKKINVRE